MGDGCTFFKHKPIKNTVVHPQANFKGQVFTTNAFFILFQEKISLKNKHSSLNFLEIQPKPSFTVSLTQLTPASNIPGLGNYKHTIFSLSSTTILNALKLPKKNKNLPLGPGQLGVLLRKVLLNTLTPSLTISVNGILPFFNFFFKKLNNPVNGIF